MACGVGCFFRGPWAGAQRLAAPWRLAGSRKPLTPEQEGLVAHLSLRVKNAQIGV